MSNPAFKPSEGKREEFRKYLEKNGIMDALTKVLVNLYEEVEKPEDALEYIRDKLAFQSGLETYAQMKATQEELQTKINELTEEIEKLKLVSEVKDENGPVDELAAEPPEILGEDAAPKADVPADDAPPVPPADDAPTENVE